MNNTKNKIILSLLFFSKLNLSLGSELHVPIEFVRSLNTSLNSYKITLNPTGSSNKYIEYFELKNKDCAKIKSWDDCKTNRERIELKQKKSTIPQNEIWNYEWSFYIPESFQNIWPVKLSIAQFYDEGADQPVWMFQVNAQGLAIEKINSKKRIYALIIKNDNLKKQWHKIKISVLWSITKNGKFDLWVNDKMVLNYRGPTYLSNEIFLKYGLYRSFLNRWNKSIPIPTQVIYFDQMKIYPNTKGVI